MPPPRSGSRSPARAADHKDIVSRRPNRWSDHRDLRSRSPVTRKTRGSRNRSRSPIKSRHHGKPHRHRTDPLENRRRSPVKDLPFSARGLTKRDLVTFKPLFAHYLSVQKQKELGSLDEREARGRWKSFVHKWNQSELAEGWYDPELFTRIAAEFPSHSYNDEQLESHSKRDLRNTPSSNDKQLESEEDDYGPTLPTSGVGRMTGASVPSLQDLSLRNELAAEAREADVEDLRAARKANRKAQKEQLDQILPRPEAGTRERLLEKRQLVNEKMRDFREKSPGLDASNDTELMGGDDSVAEYKKMKAAEQSRKTARELRREEEDRAKQAEMEERRRAWREKEEGTMSRLRKLAEQRFS